MHSTTQSRGERYLMTADEIMNQLHPDQVIAFTRGTMPIKGQRLMPNTIPNRGWQQSPALRTIRAPRLTLKLPTPKQAPITTKKKAEKETVNNLLDGL